MVNAVVIQIFNYVYSTVAFRLNEFENHKTDSAYFNALISKNFLFKFINSYNSLFYIAFFRQFEENAQLSCSRIVNPADPTQRSCLYELAYQLGILFGTMIVVNNLLEVLFPVIQTLLNVRNQRKGDSSLDLAGERSTPEKEFNLSTYDSTLSDYEELAIQFGYVCMFVTAFPLTPLFALFNNMIEIQLDANKICKLVRRPEPRGADSIGAWSTVFAIISYFSIVTNILMGVLYSTELTKFAENVTRNSGISEVVVLAVIFGAIEHTILIIKFSVETFVPDESEPIKQHKLRQEYIGRILIDGAEEEPEDLDAVFSRQKSDTGSSKSEPFFDMSEMPTFESDSHTRF